MFGGDQSRSRNPRWSTTSGQQDEAQQLPTQPSSSTSGMIPGAASFYDPNVVGQQSQSSPDDRQWLQPAATQQFAPGLGTGVYSAPYRHQPQSTRALLHESFSRQQQRPTAQPQQTTPHLLNQYNFVAPQYQPAQQTQFSLDQTTAPGYRPQALNESYLYGQVPSNPTQSVQNVSGVETYPYSQQFQFFNSPLSELANNATPSPSSSELLAYPPPHGPSVSPAISDQSSQQNTTGPTPPPPPPPTSKTSAVNPVIAAADPNAARDKPVRSSKKRKGAKRLRMSEESTTDTDEDDTPGGRAGFSIHLTQPPRGSEFVFPTRL